MIPKIIHYCWINKDPYPPLVKHCMKSWRKKLPDYQFIKWDSHNFDINSYQFTKEAYDRKKWAFVADVQRLYALYHYGGIYLDADVEIFKSLNPLLNHKAFVCFESDRELSSAVIASEKNHPWIERLLSYYLDQPFILKDGTLNTIPNPVIISDISKKEFGFVPENRKQVFKGDVHVYPNHYFSPPDFKPRDETYAIHYFQSSWHDKSITSGYWYKNILRNIRTIMPLLRLNGCYTYFHRFTVIPLKKLRDFFLPRNQGK